MESVYVEAKLKDQSRLCRLRNKLYSSVNGSYYYKKKSPHITLVPPFYINEDDIGRLEQYIDESGIEGKEVRTKDLMVWSSLREPMHFILDVECDIDNEVRDLVEHVNSLRTQLGDTPVPYHITMFSRTGMWSTAPSVLRNDIQNAIMNFDGTEDTQISEVRVNRR